MDDIEYLDNIDTETPEENLTLENQLDHFQLPPEVHNHQSKDSEEEETSDAENDVATSI